MGKNSSNQPRSVSPDLATDLKEAWQGQWSPWITKRQPWIASLSGQIHTHNETDYTHQNGNTHLNWVIFYIYIIRYIIIALVIIWYAFKWFSVLWTHMPATFVLPYLMGLCAFWCCWDCIVQWHCLWTSPVVSQNFIENGRPWGYCLPWYLPSSLVSGPLLLASILQWAWLVAGHVMDVFHVVFCAPPPTLLM